MQMKVEVYSDGSGQTSDGPGGWGYVIVVDGIERSRQGGGLTKATNNVAELQAAISGLTAVFNDSTISSSTDITLVSDSQLVLNYATGKYQCKAFHLVPLYIQLRSVFGKLNAKTRWVKGHNGDEFNEICDTLAGEARAKLMGTKQRKDP
jgi:ribonuclease HI